MGVLETPRYLRRARTEKGRPTANTLPHFYPEMKATFLLWPFLEFVAHNIWGSREAGEGGQGMLQPSATHQQAKKRAEDL